MNYGGKIENFFLVTKKIRGDLKLAYKKAIIEGISSIADILK